MFSPIVRSTWLYLQYLVAFTQVAAGYQPAATWVNATRYCKYSQVLLTMGENIARNKVEPTWNNKLIYIVHFVGYFHSCITMHGFMNVNLRFVVPCIFSHSNNQLDATINRKIDCLVVQILLNMFRALQYPSSEARQTAVAASGFNQKLQRQFDGLLMVGIVMPETCWAVSVRQGNKFYDWLLHLVGCFIRVMNVKFNVSSVVVFVVIVVFVLTKIGSAYKFL